MSKKFPGFYLYYDWVEALEELPPKKAMTIIKNMKDYLRDGVEPMPLDGRAGTLQFMIMSQLRRSKTNSENGRLGGSPSHQKPRGEKEKAPSDGAGFHFLSDEEVQNFPHTDYIKLKRRFDAEAKALASDSEWLELMSHSPEKPPKNRVSV